MDRKLVVVFIGSLKSCSYSMSVAKEFFENLGMEVLTPYDEDLQNKPLLVIQKIWINHIVNCDFVVAFAKSRDLDDNYPGETIMKYEFGESTSYELAIALKNNKKILSWTY